MKCSLHYFHSVFAFNDISCSINDVMMNRRFILLFWQFFLFILVDNKLKRGFSSKILFHLLASSVCFGIGVKSAFWNSLTDVLTPVLHKSGALKQHDTGFSSVSHLLRNYQLSYHCAYKLMVYKTGGVGMLLTAISGIVGLVQFLYSVFFQSPHFFFSPFLFSLFYLYLLIEEKFLKPKLSR